MPRLRLEGQCTGSHTAAFGCNFLVIFLIIANVMFFVYAVGTFCAAFARKHHIIEKLFKICGGRSIEGEMGSVRGGSLGGLELKEIHVVNPLETAENSEDEL